MRLITEIKDSFLVALWFIFLTFPIMVVKVDPIEKLVVWRWHNMVWVGAGSFFISFFIRYLKRRKVNGHSFAPKIAIKRLLINDRRCFYITFAVLFFFALIFPFIFSSYETNIMTTALMYVVLGLGLNIVVGLAGLLDLGYVAFYAVGAYSYALLNYHFGLGFWTCLPIGATLAAILGILLGFPVLRLRGDYLAIVTLGFGEIIRLILENWNDFSFGPSGIANIPRPSFLGLDLTLPQSTIYVYFLALLLVIFTIFVINRLQKSRIGRAWVALREDEIACQAMGIDKTKIKLAAFAMGATWAGMVGVLFAAKTTFINPASFTFMESAIILSIVVLGGMGSIIGVVIAALLFVLLPEYLRAFADYRMLLFGAVMVLMMVVRPQGLISRKHSKYKIKIAVPEDN